MRLIIRRFQCRLMFALFLMCALLLTMVPPCIAQLQTRTQIVSEGKQATALVETTAQDASGTAFCVDPAGFFVTNAHVAQAAMNQQMTLVLHPGETTQKTLTARVVRTDKAADLALLQTVNKGEGIAGLTALPLGHDDALVETDPITAFGYPFGRDLALSERSAPSISVSVGRITALRRDKDGLQFLQIDASLNPGNSGGPVLDADGKVIGVVEAGVEGAALNFAIPVHLLTKFLHTPAIQFAPTVAPGAQTETHDFQIGVAPLLPNTGPYTVTLTLSAPGQALRSFTARPAGNGLFAVAAAPVPPRTGPERLRLTVAAQEAGEGNEGVLIADVSDCGVDIAGRHLLLSQVKTIHLAAGAATVDLVNGQHVSGRVAGLSALNVSVAGAPQILNFSHFPLVTVTDMSSPPSSVDYRVTVKEGAEVVGQEAGVLWLGTDLKRVDAALDANLPTPEEAAPPVLDTENGHWYQAVVVPGKLPWADAKKRAAQMVYHGRRGHLATLTSAPEVQWVVDHLALACADDVRYWLGGFQNHAAPDYREPDGGWQWITGEPWSYTHWNHDTGEPNNANGGGRISWRLSPQASGTMSRMTVP